MYLFFTVLCRAPSLHWSILNNELHLSGSRLYGMVLVYGMADSCLYNKQNNTWTLGDMEFIFSCSHSISHSFAALTRSISMWTLEDKFHISAWPCIILYLWTWTLLIVCDLLDFDETFFVSACAWKFIAFDSNYDCLHKICKQSCKVGCFW